MSPLAQFQQNLTAAMLKKHAKAKPLSKAANLGETAIRDILKCNRDPTLTTIVKLATALNMTASELLTGVTLTQEDPPFDHAKAGWHTYEEGDQTWSVYFGDRRLAHGIKSQPEAENTLENMEAGWELAMSQ